MYKSRITIFHTLTNHESRTIHTRIDAANMDELEFDIYVQVTNNDHPYTHESRVTNYTYQNICSQY